MRSVRIAGGLEIAYREAGDGAPVVLLHGAASDGRMWGPQLDGLSDRLRVIAWDEPGSGRSSEPAQDFGLAGYADALARFIEALGFASVHVGGLSWGGVLALELYRRHPDRVTSLILADTYAGWKGSLSEAECAQRLSAALEQTSMPEDQFAPSLPGLFAPGASASAVDQLETIMADTRPSRSAAHRDRDRGLRSARPAAPHRRPDPADLGEQDARSPLTVADQFRAAIPDARLVRIPGAGHMSNIEQPERFNAAVREFCPRVQPWR